MFSTDRMLTKPVRMLILMFVHVTLISAICSPEDPESCLEDAEDLRDWSRLFLGESRGEGVRARTHASTRGGTSPCP